MRISFFFLFLCKKGEREETNARERKSLACELAIESNANIYIYLF